MMQEDDREVAYSVQGVPRRFWVDYDQEADVLYISFRRPQNADDSVMTDEGILMRYRQDELVGLTVLDASARRDNEGELDPT